jgi:hypothetical protein
MFPVYPALILLGWFVAIPLVLVASLFTKSAQPEAAVKWIWSYTWTDLPSRYAAAWRLLVTGVQL